MPVVIGVDFRTLSVRASVVDSAKGLLAFAATRNVVHPSCLTFPVRQGAPHSAP
jgi:ribulose kinase